MIVTIVKVVVIPEFVDDFIAATLDNHRGSVQEAGNLRFDILQHLDDPASFTLYEAYESEEAAAKHKETAHYLKWRDTVAPWMAKPREGAPHRVIAPAERSQW
ncbi:antibiotic biosynthesis monooxygenase [Paenibacillus montanisoli]|uniref:Antibiotic biosynthesis monooxygenase n=1 Tax=Paenibacillus montanisoli TaxID=2081970 RepID=A0A328U1H7_9BACL|nr:antibiotic biosynthesis monooxygenase [Paenibacillus montanisoli]RAP75912.1 antibiotic biosynthesis monooxygenase [Paenibacillus montanisoli]